MVSASRQEMVGHLLKVIKKGYNSINDIIFFSVEVRGSNCRTKFSKKNLFGISITWGGGNASF